MKKNFGIFLILFFFFFGNVKVFASAPYRIIEAPKGMYIIELDTSKNKHYLAPAFVYGLETNEDVYNSLKSKLVVNAGFFDPKNKKTVSYVVIDGKVVLDPKENENLMNNKTLEPYIEKILNRSEFRILVDAKGNITYDIAPHNAEIPNGLKLKHSIQGGPMLFPELRLEEEFFVLVKGGKIISESASSLHKYARTGIGIRENKVYIFIASNDYPVTLEEFADIMRKWCMDKAMAFDGGGSTSLDCKDLHIISDKDNSARKLKSFLIFK